MNASYVTDDTRGLAFAVLDGKLVELGAANSIESWATFGKLVAGQATSGGSVAAPVANPPACLTIAELIGRFMDHAKQHYPTDCKVSNEVLNLDHATRDLIRLFGSTPVADFGPQKLKVVRQAIIDRDISRRQVNARVHRIRRVFSWAVSEELIDVSILQRLATVKGLRPGRGGAREKPPVAPVAETLVDATLPFLPPVVRDMVRLQLLAGMRPCEVCRMTPGEIDRSTSPWIYRPGKHKTAHHGKKRTILIGPQAQAILLAYLDRDPRSHCFSPLENMQRIHANERAKRKSKVQPSQVSRAKHGRSKIKTHYARQHYATAIRRACIFAAGRKPLQGGEDAEYRNEFWQAVRPHLWSPNQLRHLAATKIRGRFDLDAARTILGHSDLKTTEIYAEADLTKAAAIVAEMG